MSSVDLNNLSIEDLRKIEKTKKLNSKKSLKSIKATRKLIDEIMGIESKEQ